MNEKEFRSDYEGDWICEYCLGAFKKAEVKTITDRRGDKQTCCKECLEDLEYHDKPDKEA